MTFDWDRVYSPTLNTIQWKATHRGHRYVVWLDPGEVDPGASFLVATEPSGEGHISATLQDSECANTWAQPSEQRTFENSVGCWRSRAHHLGQRIQRPGG